MSLLRYVISFTYFQNHQRIFNLHFLKSADFIINLSFPIRLCGKADNLMSLLSFKKTFDTVSVYTSRRLSHDPALKPNNTNRKSKPKLKAKP